jgi:NADH-quinone oxidoreductase subunit G
VEQVKPKTVNLTINGKPLQVDAKSTVYQAAEQAGIFIPHYCYHPDLAIAGVCRMCMCEIEKNPKLQISCNTPVADGMVVRTDTQKVRDTVKGVLELHLINHPLDCPICDKAGECKLQDYYRDYGLYKSRMEFDEKVHKPKVVDIGTIVLDSERCILCTRCVRFTADVTKTNELAIVNRGDRSELRTYDGAPLRNSYTGNLADICPVGALTAKDFRFQCRVWFLDKTTSVCTMCARGCNTVLSVNPTTRTLYRVEPRRNPEVNKSWICDTGRWDYHHVAAENRIRVPRRKQADGTYVDYSWHQAFSILNESVLASPERVGVALSTQLTNEEIADIVLTMTELGVKTFTWIVDESVVNDKNPYDGVLRHRDETPNAKGFLAVTQGLNVTCVSQADFIKKSSELDWVFLLGIENNPKPYLKSFVSKLPANVKRVFHATNDSEIFEGCEFKLPNVSAFEKSGTLVNALDRLQKLNKAIDWQFTSRDGHSFINGLKQGGDRTPVGADRAQKIFETVIVEKILMGQPNKWRGFAPLGLPIKETAFHAEAQI